MDNLNHYIHISRLIVKSFHEELSDEEQKELNNWLSTPGNSQLYGSLRQRELQTKREQIRELHPEQIWNKLEKQIPFKTKRQILPLFRYAAAVLLPVLIISIAYYHHSSKTEQPVTVSDSVIPGGPKATLILSSGKEVMLRANQNLCLPNDTTVKLNNRDNILKVENSSTHTSQPENYQTLSIPLGGEYKLILSDGTKIWLNSDSRLKFPVNLNEGKRQVYLEGEAYFEVTHHPEQPFIVHTPGMDIEVLGTKFNVKAYTEDQVISTTLAEGSVQTTNIQHKTSLLLSPNQQCQYVKSTGKMEKQNVDIHNFIGWIEGKFIFENETLEEIMKQLSRWYNTQVFYSNPEIKKYRFTGYVNRFDEIDTILHMIERTYNISFKVDGKTIIVNRK